MPTLDFTHAFRDGATATEPDGRRARLTVKEIGDLILTTGRIVACDPFCMEAYPEIETFSIIMAPGGRYRVLLSLAYFQDTDDLMHRWQRVAYAMLRFGAHEPVRWEPAHFEPKADGSTDAWDGGYGVDAGVGCFMDAEAAQALKRRLVVDTTYRDELVELSYALHRFSGQQWMQITPDPALKANVVMFDSGWGDGLYFSYVGYDDAGDVACLVTDFHVFDEGTTFE